MTEYKRLTERFGKGIVVKETSTNDSASIWNAIKRLAELEDKIENGTLVEIGKLYIKRFGETNHYIICGVKEVELPGLMSKGEAEEKLKKLRGNGNDL